jgi:gas vesicle protein GvpL/GvpF
VIWVYAVCERPDLPLPDVRGLAQEPVEGIDDGPVLAAVSRHAQAPDHPVREALWAHERVVESLMAERVVLPMRFGTTLPCARSMRAALAARRAALVAAIEGVRGRVELGVRAMQPAAARTPAATGGQYLRAKLSSAHTVAALHETLAALAVATRRWPARAPSELMRASYLVERPAVPQFRGAVERLQREHPDAALLSTGPWPAYSFVDGVGQ